MRSLCLSPRKFARLLLPANRRFLAVIVRLCIVCLKILVRALIRNVAATLKQTNRTHTTERRSFDLSSACPFCLSKLSLRCPSFRMRPSDAQDCSKFSAR